MKLEYLQDANQILSIFFYRK